MKQEARDNYQRYYAFLDLSQMQGYPVDLGEVAN